VARRVVRVIHQPKIIKVLADPVRREILRQLRHEPQTQKDFENTPPYLQKYFLQFHIERLRGMLSVFQLIGKKRGEPIDVTSDELKELAHEVARQMAKVGKRYERTGATLNRETLLIEIYSEALKEVITQSRWKDFFDLIVPNENKIIEAT